MLIGASMTGELLENGSIIASRSKFDTKIEASSAKMYFHYYGQLLHQQNMLQDFVRTGQLFTRKISVHLFSCHGLLLSA
jgi:type I protein arginine methyltransferase